MSTAAVVAAWLPAEGAFGGWGAVIVVGVGLLLLVSLLFALLLLARGQQGREIRELVVTLEELRSGHTRRRAEVDPRSSLAVLSDAVNRLAQDLSGRLGSAERSREQLRAFLETARDYGVVATDPDWDIHSFSPGATELFGWSEEEALGRPVSLLFHEASWKDLLPKLARRSLRERGVQTRSVMARRDGSGFHADLLVRELRGSGEEPSGYLIVARDVTTQVRLERELHDSEARYRSLVEGLSEGVIIVQDGRIAYANPAAGRILGAATDRLGGQALRDWVATADLLRVEESLRSISGREGTHDELACTLVSPRGEPLARARLQVTGVRHDGRPAVLISVFDETVERKVTAELRRNESRLDAVLEATSDGIVVLTDTPAGRVVGLTNRAFLSSFGLESRRVLGAPQRDLEDLLRSRAGGAEAVAEFLASPGAGTRRRTVTLAGEPARVLELESAPLVDRDGRPLGRVVACRDLSDQKAFEHRLEQNAEELRRSKVALERAYAQLDAVNGDLRRRADDLDRLNRELQKLGEMKSNLLANVSHELQTPLVSIRGYTEMILKGRLGAVTDEQRKGLTLSLKNIDRLISMIDNLLTFARMDREAAEIKISTFPLRAVVDESLETLSDRITAKGISVSRRLEDADAPIRGDRDKIVQVFLNLLTNAVKFNRDGGKVEIASHRGQPGQVTVQVRDTGAGIPAESLERIFERFYRETAGLEEGREGSGIGLSIVRDILRLHGCTIHAESTVGVGSTFSFTLPLDEAQGVGPSASRAARDDVEPPGPAPAAQEPPPATSERETPPRPRFRVIRRPESG